LQELNAGNLRYVTGTHLHRDFGPERVALAAGQRPFADQVRVVGAIYDLATGRVTVMA
jgi:hypothetical protein